MAFDDNAKALAARMLAPKPKGKGQAVQVHFPATGGTYNPATQTVEGASPPVTRQGSGVEVAYEAKSIDGTVIQRGDVQFLLSPVQINGADMPEPPAEATLTKADGLWTIKNVEKTSPAGMGVLFELQLRRN